MRLLTDLELGVVCGGNGNGIDPNKEELQDQDSRSYTAPPTVDDTLCGKIGNQRKRDNCYANAQLARDCDSFSKTKGKVGEDGISLGSLSCTTDTGSDSDSDSGGDSDSDNGSDSGGSDD